MQLWTDAYVSCLRMGNEERVWEKVVEKAENASEKEIARIVRVKRALVKGQYVITERTKECSLDWSMPRSMVFLDPTLSWKKG